MPHQAFTFYFLILLLLTLQCQPRPVSFYQPDVCAFLSAWPSLLFLPLHSLGRFQPQHARASSSGSAPGSEMGENGWRGSVQA